MGRMFLSGLIFVWLQSGWAEAAVQTSLSYDYLGRVIQITQQGQTEDYFYSGEKRVFKKEASGKKRLYLFEEHSVVFDREVEFGKRGDADGNGLWTITDAVYLITYIFGGGPAPTPNLLAGDANGSDQVTLSDAVYLITYIFGGGPAPSSETLSLPGAGYVEAPGAGYVEAPGAGRLWSDGAMGGEDLWYVEDPVSSTSAVLAGNALIDVVHSTPFGEQLTTATLEKRYLFTGKELDATTGLFYYGARYYDPALGRFLQWDSVMDGPNRYLYVKNNPINANDPSGHEDWIRSTGILEGPADSISIASNPANVAVPNWFRAPYALQSPYRNFGFTDDNRAIWAAFEIRSRLSESPVLVTLDSHTDTCLPADWTWKGPAMLRQGNIGGYADITSLAGWIKGLHRSGYDLIKFPHIFVDPGLSTEDMDPFYLRKPDKHQAVRSSLWRLPSVDGPVWLHVDLDFLYSSEQAEARGGDPGWQMAKSKIDFIFEMVDRAYGKQIAAVSFARSPEYFNVPWAADAEAYFVQRSGAYSWGQGAWKIDQFSENRQPLNVRERGDILGGNPVLRR